MSQKFWHHPGGKLREVGPEALSDAELLAILISSGVKDKPAGEIANGILAKFGSFKGMANQQGDILHSGWSYESSCRCK